MADGMSRSTNGRRIGVVAVQALGRVPRTRSPGSPTASPTRRRSCSCPATRASTWIDQRPTFDSVANYAATTKLRGQLLRPNQIAVPAAPGLRGAAQRAAAAGDAGAARRRAASGPCRDRCATGPCRGSAPRPDFGAVREAADRLLRAERPLIWSGHGVLYAEAWAELTEVAELLGAPVMTTLMGKSGFDETPPAVGRRRPATARAR